MKDYEEVFPSLARTATSTKTFHTKRRAGFWFINVTAVTATPSVVFTIKGHDPISNTSYDILVSAAITGTGMTVLRVSEHLTAAANTIAKDMLPEAMSLLATHGDADSITYSVGFLGVD
jgi:hypothetical protein